VTITAPGRLESPLMHFIIRRRFFLFEWLPNAMNHGSLSLYKKYLNQPSNCSTYFLSFRAPILKSFRALTSASPTDESDIFACQTFVGRRLFKFSLAHINQRPEMEPTPFFHWTSGASSAICPSKYGDSSTSYAKSASVSKLTKL
jgi:hypothetical protein